MATRTRHVIGWVLAVVVATIGLVGVLICIFIAMETSGATQIVSGAGVVGGIGVSAVGLKLKDKLTGESGQLRQ